MYWEREPWLMGRQVLPPSLLRNVPAAEMATNMRWDYPIQHDGMETHSPGSGLPAGA